MNYLSEGGCPHFPDRIREKQFSYNDEDILANVSLASGLKGVKQGPWQSMLSCWESCARKFPEEHPRVHLHSNLRESQTFRLRARADFDKAGHKLTQELVCYLAVQSERWKVKGGAPPRPPLWYTLKQHTPSLSL